MAVVVPSSDQINYGLYSQILNYQAQLRPINLGGGGVADAGGAQGVNLADRLAAAQMELVLNLVSSRNLFVADVLNNCSYPSSNPLIAAAANWDSLASSYGGSADPRGVQAAESAAQVRQQLLTELLGVGGGLSASTVLSTMTYTGPSAAGTL